MQLISKFNKGIRFLLRVINNCSKYAWAILLKDKKGIAITNAFQENSEGSIRKPNKIWVDKDSEFYHRSIKSWQKNDIKMYSTHNEGKIVVAETFINTSNYKIYEHMT